jgi:hypothetical protein
VSAPLKKTKVPGVYRRGRRYAVLYRDPYGRQRSRAAATLAEARLLKSALTAEVARGEYRALSGVTFAEYFPEWIASYAGRTSRGFREQTRQEYKRDLERHALPFFGPLKLAEVEPRDVKRFIGQLIGLGLTSSSVRRRLAPLRALFATAVEDGLIRSNPISRIPWGAFTRSHAAAASYSWIRPPNRSRRRMGVADAAGAPRVDGIVSGGSGARRSSARCGLCSL